MTTFNTDYNNTELLDQELTTAELSEVSGGCTYLDCPSMKDREAGTIPQAKMYIYYR
ncbi:MULTISPECIES: hypothetical protein [unclassified Prochlorococcus]|uniref:hypothetical protein n=1 Tax=unclassified Prochlorococcus TaxID=2627481 RepID=UPI00187CF6E3|nr:MULTISPECIES: hypothetical protein [unclassified Prochlorococcus]